MLRKTKKKADIGKNIKTEEDAGKDPAQAAAIALNTFRHAGGHYPKKRAKR